MKNSKEEHIIQGLKSSFFIFKVTLQCFSNEVILEFSIKRGTSSVRICTCVRTKSKSVKKMCV